MSTSELSIKYTHIPAHNLPSRWTEVCLRHHVSADCKRSTPSRWATTRGMGDAVIR